MAKSPRLAKQADLETAQTTADSKMLGSDLTEVGPITFSATITAPTKGGVTLDSMKTRKVGDHLHVVISFEKNTGGTNGSGDYLIEIPETVDATKIAKASIPNDLRGSVLGSGKISNTSTEGLTSSHYTKVVYAGGNYVKLLNFTGSTANTNTFFSDSNFAFGQVVFIYAEFRIPIQGWTATT